MLLLWLYHENASLLFRFSCFFLTWILDNSVTFKVHIRFLLGGLGLFHHVFPWGLHSPGGGKGLATPLPRGDPRLFSPEQALNLFSQLG